MPGNIDATVLESLEHTRSILEDITRERADLGTRLATFGVKLDSLEEDVREVLHIFRGGRGQDGIQIQLRKVESDVKFIEAELTRIKKASEADTRGKWIVIAAMISGGAGLVTAIVNTIMK